MKSIKNLIADKINEVRGMLKIWDSPSSTTEEKGRVLAELVGNDPTIWKQIAAVASRKPATKVTAPATAAVSGVKSAPKSAMTAPGTILVAPASRPVMAVKPMPAKPVEVTAPARTLRVEPTLAQKRDRFINSLRQFVADNGHVDDGKVRENLVGMLNSGVELEEKHFAAIFAAAKKANTTGFYIIDKKSNGVFYRAPMQLVDDYVFGQDGEMVQVLAGLNEITDISKAGRVVARVYIMLDALDALKQAGKLGEFETGRVETLLATVKKLEHKKLAEEVEKLLSSSVQEELKNVHEKAKVENRPFAALAQMVS